MYLSPEKGRAIERFCSQLYQNTPIDINVTAPMELRAEFHQRFYLFVCPKEKRDNQWHKLPQIRLPFLITYVLIYIGKHTFCTKDPILPSDTSVQPPQESMAVVNSYVMRVELNSRNIFLSTWVSKIGRSNI